MQGFSRGDKIVFFRSPVRFGFWAAQRFQRCGNRLRINAGFQLRGDKTVFFRSPVRFGFWVVQRFQRCGTRSRMNAGFQPRGDKTVFFRSAVRFGFWAAQRFQRCGNRLRMNAGFQLRGDKTVFFRSPVRFGFWVAQRFQRCGTRSRMNAGFQPRGDKTVFFRSAVRFGFWAAQRFQRCGNRSRMNAGFQLRGDKIVFFRSLVRCERSELPKPQRGERLATGASVCATLAAPGSSATLSPSFTPAPSRLPTPPWTRAPDRGTIAGSRVVPAPPSAAPLVPFEGGSLAMNRKQCPGSAIRVLGLFMVILTLSAAASAEWKEKVLYSFQGGTSDGAVPAGGVVFDAAGNLYGATSDGGASCPLPGCGIAFQLAPPAKQGDPWTETVLHVFSGNGNGDGATPAGGLSIDSAGNLYGTTGYGGTGNCVLLGSKTGCGVVYELVPPKSKGGQWTEKILYSFQGGNDGDFPAGNLTFDKAGNLYGATQYGGGFGSCNAPYFQNCGVVFRLSPPVKKGGKWKEKVLYSFKSGTDGANPNGGLVLDSKGAIYGTTFSGGNQSCKADASVGCGTAFKLRPPTNNSGAWAEKQLHVFTGGDDGGLPSSGVIFNPNGALYGAAEGGLKMGGLVFRLVEANGGKWKETIVYGFSSDSYSYTPAVAAFDKSGNLYGTTNVGPSHSLAGSVFRLKPPSQKGGSWSLILLHGFTGVPDAALPNVSLVFDKSGNPYGAASEGGTGTGCSFHGCGAVFEVEP